MFPVFKSFLNPQDIPPLLFRISFLLLPPFDTSGSQNQNPSTTPVPILFTRTEVNFLFLSRRICTYR